MAFQESSTENTETCLSLSNTSLALRYYITGTVQIYITFQVQRTVCIVRINGTLTFLEFLHHCTMILIRCSVVILH